jgi:hypothetical protein
LLETVLGFDLKIAQHFIAGLGMQASPAWRANKGEENLPLLFGFYGKKLAISGQHSANAKSNRNGRQAREGFRSDVT